MPLNGGSLRCRQARLAWQHGEHSTLSGFAGVVWTAAGCCSCAWARSICPGSSLGLGSRRSKAQRRPSPGPGLIRLVRQSRRRKSVSRSERPYGPVQCAGRRRPSAMVPRGPPLLSPFPRILTSSSFAPRERVSGGTCRMLRVLGREQSEPACSIWVSATACLQAYTWTRQSIEARMTHANWNAHRDYRPRGCSSLQSLPARTPLPLPTG